MRRVVAADGLDRDRHALGSLLKAQVDRGGASFIELDLDVDERSLVTLTKTANEGEFDVEAMALTEYETDPPMSPAECVQPEVDGDVTTLLFDSALCTRVSIVVSNLDLDAAASETLSIQVGDRVDTTLSNGLIRMGVHAGGHLNVPGYDASSGTGTTTVGLRWLPTNADALAPGCECEGWGVADLDQGIGSWANESDGGTRDLSVLSASF